jgi:hypothetical protein
MSHVPSIGFAIAVLCTSSAIAAAHGEEPPAPTQSTNEASPRPDVGHVGPPGALALAAVIAAASPLLSSAEKEAVTLLFAGKNDIPYSKKIVVTADAILCRVSNVDITFRSCELTFGKTVKTIDGRAANELYTTEAMADVPSEAAMGTIYEGLSKLHCTIDPQQIKQQDGGGADCTYLKY